MELRGEAPVLARARAAARLRARDALRPAERRAVREARGEVGAALRRVRAGRALAPTMVAITAPVSLGPLPARRPLWRLAPIAVVLGLVLVALSVVNSQEPATDAAGGTPEAAEATLTTRAQENVTSRGRSSEAVVFVAAEPTPEPSAEPTAEPIAAPVPSAAVLPRATAGTGTGSGVTSGPGGGGNGTGTSPAPAPTATAPPTPSPTLRPTAAPTQAPRAAGMTRFTGRVLDSRTGRALSGVCVIVGVRQCNERDVYTDVNGRFAIDLPVGGTWDVNFGRVGYASGYRRLISASARTTDIGTIRLTARP